MAAWILPCLAVWAYNILAVTIKMWFPDSMLAGVMQIIDVVCG